VSLPLATISFISIFDFAEANEGLAKKALELYYIHVAERAFAKGVFIHSVSLEAMESVHFEI
jgi:hypothetical protein